MENRFPSLYALRVFEAAARQLSFKQAAQELSVTPTAVSHQIRGLEDQLGMQLFERRSRSLSLTRAGLAMLPKLKEGMFNIKEAVEVAHKTRSCEHIATLQVSAPPSFASYWLTQRLHRCVSQIPGTHLFLEGDVKNIDGNEGHCKNIEEIQTVIDGDGCMHSLRVRFGHGYYPGHHVDYLFSSYLVPVCSPKLLNSKNILETPEDVSRFMLLHDDTIQDLNERPSWEEWLLHIGMRRQKIRSLPGMHFKSSGLALAAAEDGLGIVLASYQLAADSISQGKLVAPFLIPIKRLYAYYLVLNKSELTHPVIAKVRAWLLVEAMKAREFGEKIFNRN